MQWAKRSTVCSVCEPDQSVWHREQKGTGWSWSALTDPKVPQHGYPTPQRPRLKRDLSGSFPIVNSVKQGFVLTPTLFSIFFSMMLKQVTEDLDDDGAVYIRYRLDRSQFNPRRLRAHTKTLEQLLWPLRWQRCPRCLHRKSPATHNSLLCRGCPALWTLGLLKRDWGPSPTCRSQKNTALPTSPSVELSLKQFISSPIWDVSSHQTPSLTGKYTTDWPRQTALLANFTKEYWTTSV